MIQNESLYQFLSLLVTAIVTFLVPYLRRLLLARINAEQLATAGQVARIVVRAIEQTVTATHGPDKLQLALNRARDYAASLGISLTNEQWEALLEQAVLELNRQRNAGRESDTPAA